VRSTERHSSFRSFEFRHFVMATAIFPYQTYSAASMSGRKPGLCVSLTWLSAPNSRLRAPQRSLKPARPIFAAHMASDAFAPSR